MRYTRHMRVVAGLTAAVLGIALAGCATVPANAPVELSGESATKFNTGRVTVVVTDFGGTPLRLARVDVEGINDHQSYFRTAAFSDVWGRVSFAGVPERVRISLVIVDHEGKDQRYTTQTQIMLQRSLNF